MGMVIFATKCYENLGDVGVVDLLLCNKDIFKCIFSCNCIKVELEI